MSNINTGGQAGRRAGVFSEKPIVSHGVVPTLKRNMYRGIYI